MVALVTGASSGIGREFAVQLVNQVRHPLTQAI
jgi:short-subunit dehydrogenase